MQLKTRIAPTPSGLLHAGNGAAFLLAYALTKASEGKILLRIDDLDAERVRLEYVEDIFQTLDWLGIEWDEGPSSIADFQQRWSQHHRLDLYEDALNKLKNTEGLLYACTCSRRQIRETAINGLYPQTCRFQKIPFTQKETAWRMHMPKDKIVFFKNFDIKNKKITSYPSVIGHETGDFIVRKKNGLPSYQIASLVDDEHFGVNLVIRGVDLLPSTGIQISIAQELGNKNFEKTLFLHHNLAVNSSGEKLSKSKGASSLADWRKKGISCETLIKQAAQWLYLPEKIGQMNELIAACKTLRILADSNLGMRK